jgi:hypothetical protein
VHVAALFDLWDLFLRDTGIFRHAHSRQLSRLAQLLQRHFPCDQHSGTRLDLLATSGAFIEERFLGERGGSCSI